MIEHLDLAILLPDVADSLRPRAEAQGPAARLRRRGDATFDGDSDALIRLFSNLIDNAIKYTPAAGQVTVSGRKGTSIPCRSRWRTPA